MAIAVAYYFRLPDTFIKTFEEKVSTLFERLSCPIKERFSVFVDEELKHFYEKMLIPQGIAKTKSLQMNLFCNVVCMQARIPLLITGDPGRSKTLSFNIACDNMKGPASKRQDFKPLKNVTRYHYQCSESSTASEIQSVYRTAVNNQTGFEQAQMFNEQCVVFLDEGGSLYSFFFVVCLFLFPLLFILCFMKEDFKSKRNKANQNLIYS